ncbi:TPA: GNAT family N-acetyltransferase [Candidatus Woesearchaeota archaeon]|nr:GNAT family N-acetyltransferase [Candidatus Woesearchaeota archaeon]
MIRQMAKKDLPKVSTIYKDANKFTSRNEILKWTTEDLKRFPRYHLVFESKGEVLGAISATLHRKDLAVIEDIAVKRMNRSHTIGSRLIEKILAILKEDKIPTVRLWVHWTDAAAIPFYYLHGFKLKMFRHTHGMAGVPDNEDIVFLERKLK